MTDAVLSACGVTLVRATICERADVERLQHAAYAANRLLLGVEPVPLLADYEAIFRGHEVWIRRAKEAGGAVEATLILETNRDDDILVWSVATSPATQKQGLGQALLQCAEQRARELGRDYIRLYTGKPLTHLIDWYARSGYEVEYEEQLADRALVHMIKKLA